MNRLSRFVALLAVLAGTLPAAQARAQPPVGYPPPPPYGPPPGYPPPVYGPAPPYAYPTQPARGFRPFALGLGLGVGGVVFHDAFGRAREGGLSYTLRAGFGVTRAWLVFLGVEGTGANHMTYGVWQTAYLLGVQYFALERLYLRAGFGVANATAADTAGIALGGTGAAFMFSAGVEIAQGTSTSLGLEPSITAARQGDQTWSNFGLNFVLSFF